MDRVRGEREWGVKLEKGEEKEDGFLEHAEEDVEVVWRQCG